MGLSRYGGSPTCASTQPQAASVGGSAAGFAPESTSLVPALTDSVPRDDLQALQLHGVPLYARPDDSNDPERARVAVFVAQR